MELILVLAIILFQNLFINFIKVVNVVGAFWIYAFVDNEVFAVFFVNQWVFAVWTFQRVGLWKTIFFRRERSGADFAQDLPFRTIIFVEIGFRSIAARTCAVVINITFRASVDSLDFFTILPFEIRDVFFIIPFFVVDNLWKFINLEFLVFGRMWIIKSPLLKRNLSADKI